MKYNSIMLAYFFIIQKVVRVFSGSWTRIALILNRMKMSKSWRGKYILEFESFFDNVHKNGTSNSLQRIGILLRIFRWIVGWLWLEQNLEIKTWFYHSFSKRLDKFIFIKIKKNFVERGFLLLAGKSIEMWENPPL